MIAHGNWSIPEEVALWETGAKAAAPTREAMVRIALNMITRGI